MKFFLWIFLATSFYSLVQAKDITGTWRYIDDKTGEAKGIVKIERQENGTFIGTALKTTPRAGYIPPEICKNCPAPFTNKPIIGMQVITGLKSNNGTNYTDGKVIDPESGKTYSLKARLNPTGNKLFLRGYLGASAIGRTQVWLRIE